MAELSVPAYLAIATRLTGRFQKSNAGCRKKAVKSNRKVEKNQAGQTNREGHIKVSLRDSLLEKKARFAVAVSSTMTRVLRTGPPF